MENRKLRWGKIFGLFILVWLLHDFINFQSKGGKVMEIESSIPKPNLNQDILTYDFYKEEWVYRREPLVITPRKKYPVNIESEVRDYLEEHITDYREQTYWGEDYNPRDPEDVEEEY